MKLKESLVGGLVGILIAAQSHADQITRQPRFESKPFENKFNTLRSVCGYRYIVPSGLEPSEDYIACEDRRNVKPGKHGVTTIYRYNKNTNKFEKYMVKNECVYVVEFEGKLTTSASKDCNP